MQTVEEPTTKILTSEAVRELLASCDYARAVAGGGLPPHPKAKLIRGVRRVFCFHPIRLSEHKADIELLLRELAAEFLEGGGTVPTMCFDRHGEQWGEEVDAEVLCALAIATEQGEWVLPRERWSELSHGPYVVFLQPKPEPAS
jgi:hypothetical protein